MNQMPDSVRKDVHVCPYCSYEVGQDSVCTSCGRRLDLGDWPVSAAYSPEGLQAETVDGKVRYSLPQSETSSVAHIREGMVTRCYRIPDQDPLTVGGALSDVIRIDSSDSVRVVFYRDRRERGCWILDRSRWASVRVNNSRPVRNCRLRADDVIDIAGVKLSFDGNTVSLFRTSSTGVTLSAHGVSVAIEGREILRNISFTVNPGEFVGVLGPSGCGKSTLLQHIAGLTSNAVCEGRVTFNGISRTDLPGSAVGICAYLPQNAEEMLHPTLSLREEMDCFLDIHAVRDGTSEQVESILGLLGLIDVANTRVSKLSGGQKRRAAIAMTLLRRPSVLLLDEPTAGLDPAADAEVMMYLRKIAGNKGISILCSTHVLGNMNNFTRIMAFTGARGSVPGLNGRLVFYDAPERLITAVAALPCDSSKKDADAVSQGAERLSKVYEALLYGAPAMASLGDKDALEPESVLPDNLPPAPSVRASFTGYLKRMWTAFRYRGGGDPGGGILPEFFAPLRNALGFLGSSCAFLFLWLPLGIVACIRIGCAGDFSEPSSGALYFCCLIALFLLGLCHSATRLVDGRVPGRCLERLAGVSVTAYLCAKITGSVGLCLAQTLSFCFFWELSVHLPQTWFAAAVDSSVQLTGPMTTVWTVPVMFFSSMMGSLVGLSVSSVVKERSAAVNCVPVVAVIVLFFSQPNIGYRLSDVLSKNRDSEPTMAEKFSYVTPTVVSQRFLVSCYRKAAAENAAERADATERSKMHLKVVTRDFKAVGYRFFLLVAFYFSLAFLVLWRYEPLSESRWNGR